MNGNTGNVSAFPAPSGAACYGLTKRELISVLLMQEMVAKITPGDLLKHGPAYCLEGTANLAIQGADILINKLNP
jgi:hypothetical protein